MRPRVVSSMLQPGGASRCMVPCGKCVLQQLHTELLALLVGSSLTHPMVLIHTAPIHPDMIHYAGLLQRGLARVFGTSLSPFTQHASASVVAASWLLGSTPTGALATNAAAGPTQRAPGSWHAGDGMPGVEQGHAGGSFMGSQPSPYGPHHAQQRGRRQVSVGGTVGPAALRAPGQELPLHYLERDRARFAYATYLLNKDIEQLLNVSHWTIASCLVSCSGRMTFVHDLP
jgi:hypothetical protein